MIINFIKQLFDLDNKKKIAPIISKTNAIENICEINYKLLANQEIELSFIHKDIQESSTEKISNIAECCANLIIMINSGLLKKQLIDTIKHLKKNSMDNEKNTLLLDNILFFNNLLQEEIKNIKKDSGPLIRPSNVFKSTG
jgi:hypothetical protein